MQSLNLYFDIDGVLVTKGKPANHLTEFLDFVTQHFPCFWLTSHCKSGVNRVAEHLKPILSSEQLALADKIMPNDWLSYKTEGINFSLPFLWFDDYLPIAESKILAKNNAVHKCIVVDLHTYPNRLLSLKKQLQNLYIN